MRLRSTCIRLLLLLLCLEPGCRLPGDLRALSRATTDLAHTMKEEVPPTTEAIREAMTAIEEDAQERERQTLLVGGGVVSCLALLALWLRKRLGLTDKKIEEAERRVQASSSPPSSSPG